MGDDDEAKRGKEVDARTIFIRGLPYTISDSQLEEAFSDVGPVRRAFTVKEKASEKHRGFGYVQFAIAEDAKRAVDSKNDTSMDGRKIKVELARKRPSFNERQKKKQAGTVDEALQEKATAPENKDINNVRPEASGPSDEGKQKQNHDKESRGRNRKKRELGKKQEPSQSNASATQRPARTVVIGNLGDPETAEAVLTLAKKQGTVESIDKNLSKEYIDVHGLSRDGCKLPAAAIVFTSVTAARQAVAKYHLHKLGDEVFWARQLGGEGAKLKKWRLIVRNLPFKVTDTLLRESFSSAGFVWEVTVPRKPDGRSKGFAFIGYTCKNDAEKAIKAWNGKVIANRTIAVDWAVAKVTYENIVHKAEEENEENDRDNETASESEDDEAGTGATEEEDDEDEDKDEDTEGEHEEEDEKENEEAEDAEEEEVAEESLDERSLLKKVLAKVVTEPGKKKEETVSDKEAQPQKSSVAKAPEANTMERTLFLRNLPLDAKVHDMKKKLTEFGEVVSFRLVLHPATKKPKGTAFVEFATREAAEAVVKATENAEEGTSSFSIGGSSPIAHFAVDRNAAREMSTRKSIEERENDRRNLYLLKEGYIEPGTQAAYGVSKADLLRRQSLQAEKATKLKSPNFHVSKTRLAIHNFPRSLTEKEIKQMFINAVISRASKQRPVIKQVKLLTDDKGNSRGSGFVEFKEHQHAIVALRVLNNNPETFSADKRPIVEFAIENIARLKKRESQLAAQKLRSKSINKDNSASAGKRKRETKDDEQEEQTAKGTKTNKKKKHKAGVKQGQGVKEKPPGRKKTRKERENRENEQKRTMEKVGTGKSMDKGSREPETKSDAKKRKLGGAKEDNNKSPGEASESKKRQRGNRAGKQEEEKLDRLVDEYRKKYFSDAGTKEGVKNLTRWFEQ